MIIKKRGIIKKRMVIKKRIREITLDGGPPGGDEGAGVLAALDRVVPLVAACEAHLQSARTAHHPRTSVCI